MLRFLLVFVVVIALLLHNLPLLVRDQVVIWLLNNGAEKAELKSINVDWFNGKVSVDRLSATAEGKPPLRVGQLILDLDYEQLTAKRAVITDASLSGVAIGVLEEKEHLWLGPLDLNQFSAADDESQEATEESDWSFGVAQFQLNDIDWQAAVAGQSHRLQLSSARLADFYLWDQQQRVSIDLDGQINGAPIKLVSSSRPLPDEKSSELNIQLKNFPVHSVTLLFVPELRAHVDLDLRINAHTNAVTQVTELSQSGVITLNDLAYSREQLDIAQRQIRWQGDLNLRLAGSLIKGLTTNSQVALKNMQLKQGDTQVDLGAATLASQVELQGMDAVKLRGLKLDANQLVVKQAANTLVADQLAIAAEAKSDDLKIWQAGLDRVALSRFSLEGKGSELVSLAAAEITGGTVEHLDRIALNTLGLKQLVVQGDGGIFTQWQRIDASDIEFKDLAHLSIGQLQLGDSKSRVSLSPKRELTDLNWLLAHLESDQQPSKVKPDTPSDNSAPFRFQLKQLLVNGRNQINVVDRGVKPAFKTDLNIERLKLSQVDTGSKGKTTFDLLGKSAFATLKAKGAIELFSGNYGGHWDAAIKGLELPNVSPYSLEYTGYYLQSGQLSLTTKGTIKKRKLDGDTDIRLNKLQVEAQNERSGEFDQKVSMPLGTAIMVLQDNDDNIDLQIPLDGSLDDPQFGYQTVINKLAGKGLKSAAMGYLTKALQPFGALISIGQMVMDAQDKGSFITLQPVKFEPADSVLNADNKAYMQKLKQMMLERKAMRLNICGSAVASDQAAIWPLLLEENKKRKEPLAEEALKAELNPRLQQLAEARSSAVKGYLSAEGIDVERLFSCYPKVDLDSKEEPQVRLGI